MRVSHVSLTSPTGLLLSGPPGVGKTFLAARVARECNARLVTVHSQDIVSPFAGDSEKMLRDVFAEAQEWATGHRRPCVVFVDELDALAPKRDDATQQDGRLVAQLLTILGRRLGSLSTCILG